MKTYEFATLIDPLPGELSDLGQQGWHIVVVTMESQLRPASNTSQTSFAANYQIVRVYHMEREHEVG